MRPYRVVAFFIAAAGTAPAGKAYAADTPRPRGVGPEFAKFYTSADVFTCISNPAIQIPKSHINDNYCDCPDGSDEPGSSACAYLSPLSPQTPSNVAIPDINTTIALPGFYCKNKGHNPSYIPFTYVNDGICDFEVCCDGSDEWQGVGGVKCPDRCAEIGKEWKSKEELRQKSMTEAMRRRKDLVREASRLKRSAQDNIKDLLTQIHGTELKISQLEKEKEEVERRERSKVVQKPGAGGKASVIAGLARERLDQMRDGLRDLMQQRNKYKDQLAELESIMSTFKEEYNPNFNDEGVKRAVRAWEEYVARDTPESNDGSGNRDRDYEDMASGAGEIDWEEFEKAGPEEGTSTDDIDVVYRFEAYLPRPLREWVDKKLRDFRETLIKNGILATPSEGGPVDNKATQEATTRLNSAKRDLESQRKQKQENEEDLTKDYGKDDVFRALKNQCVSLDSGEYTYEMCWMNKVTQKSKKGHSQNGMGNFVRFDTISVDEDVPVDGKGLGSGERVALKYENGAHCWNGPSRSTTVVLACFEKEEIWKVREEEKCVYRMEVGTPAVCEAPANAAGVTKDKDEL